MSFWSLALPKIDAPALAYGADADSARIINYAELAQRTDDFGARLNCQTEKCLGVILGGNTPQAIYAFLAALRNGDAVMLLSEQTDPTSFQDIIRRYRPEWIFKPRSLLVPEGYLEDNQTNEWCLARRISTKGAGLVHPDLALLLSTSGTTGSSKMVKLTYGNIASNAAAIAEYLAIDSSSRAITTLPFSYSFGMSVLNSHLEVGASLVLTESSLMTREFWDTFFHHRVTSIAGVPYTYEMLHRLNPRKLALESLCTLTQAGGRLAPHLLDYFSELSNERGWRFFVMYGQTEAAPRISYVPSEMLPAKTGSIGISIPGGRLSLSDDGELMYEGPNVMMGYAEKRQDLALGDELSGRLATGDLARVDEDGYFYLKGRLKRILKVHGNRLNLDEIEKRLETLLHQPVAAVGEDDRLEVYLSLTADTCAAKEVLTNAYRLHPTTFKIRQIESLPYTSSGKKSYSELNTF